MEEVEITPESIDQAWTASKNTYKEVADSVGNGKYNFIHWATTNGEINMKRVDDLCKDVLRRKADIDMQIISLIRLLYLIPKEKHQETDIKYAINKISSVLDDFPFWPSLHDPPRAGADEVCFWTENHILMLLSSAHLYRQWQRHMKRKNFYNAPNAVAGGRVREVHEDALHDVAKSRSESVQAAAGARNEESLGFFASLFSSSAPAPAPTSATEPPAFKDIPNFDGKGKGGHQSYYTDNTTTSAKHTEAVKSSLMRYYEIVDAHWKAVEKGEVPAEATAKTGGTPRPELELKGAALEEALLHSYINAHVKFGGLFEVSSAVYSCFTASALLNLIDFSEDAELANLAREMLEKVLTPLMLCTTDKGVCNLSASCRAFLRTRTRVRGHNINQVVNYFFGQSPDDISCYQISDFLSTTTWRPPPHLLKLRNMNGRVQVKLSPSLETLLTMFPGIPPLEITPFIWSAGFLVHPSFVKQTQAYQTKKQLGKNATLALFGWIPTAVAKSLSSAYGRLARGQVYTNVLMSVYKRPGGLCLSSFESFNVGDAGFQQLPWMANLDGVGVWSESGYIGGGVLNFTMTNSHSPNIVQRGGLLVCSYAAPQDLQSSLFSSSSKMWTHVIWPAPLFDKQCLYVLDEDGRGYNACGKDTLVSTEGPSWRLASRNECYIGIGCMQPTSVVAATDEDTGIQIEIDGDKVFASRITSATKYSLYVVVVASYDEYNSDFSSFVDRCLSIKCAQESVKDKGERVRKVRVLDPLEGTVDVESVL